MPLHCSRLELIRQNHIWAFLDQSLGGVYLIIHPLSLSNLQVDADRRTRTQAGERELTADEKRRKHQAELAIQVHQ